MSTELLKAEVGRIRRVVRSVGFRKGACLDSFEVFDAIHKIEDRSRRGLWVLGWNEYSVGGGLVMFIRLVNEDGYQFLVRVRFNIGTLSLEVPLDSMYSLGEFRGITAVRVGDHVQIVGRIYCVEDVRIRRLRW
ncbi:hypothetical protein [Vulcanisaeta thermophila]|uniref:hypothetical protein n=1 Tax=Vulcanisaeta thermophila TaxID=867917 RepID=UPI000853D03B|nr:hypothetical protein [Vulcanisaeta thermophila]